MIITRTPFRISFLGGGTDYPQWSQQHGGCVLSTAIDKYCYINCRYLPPFFAHHSRIIYSQIENVANNSAIVHPAVRACLQRRAISAGIEIHHDADLPARTGLGTSSSFVVGLLLALSTLQQQYSDPRELAREAITVEQEQLGETVGAQDQIAAAFGGFNFIRFDRDGAFEVEPLAVDPERLQVFADHLHLYFTGFTRTASEIARAQLENLSRRVGELEQLAHLAAEGRKCLCDPTRSLNGFGALLEEAWQLKRTLSGNVSNPHLDSVYEKARRHGATGGKLLGAGGGGFMLFFVPPAQASEFEIAMRPLLRVPFRLGAPGSRVVLNEPEVGYPKELELQRHLAYVQTAG